MECRRIVKESLATGRGERVILGRRMGILAGAAKRILYERPTGLLGDVC